MPIPRLPVDATMRLTKTVRAHIDRLHMRLEELERLNELLFSKVNPAESKVRVLLPDLHSTARDVGDPAADQPLPARQHVQFVLVDADGKRTGAIEVGITDEGDAVDVRTLGDPAQLSFRPRASNCALIVPIEW